MQDQQLLIVNLCLMLEHWLWHNGKSGHIPGPPFESAICLPTSVTILVKFHHFGGILIAIDISEGLFSI